MITSTRKTFEVAATWDTEPNLGIRWCGYDQLIQAWEKYIARQNEAIAEAEQTPGPLVALATGIVKNKVVNAETMVRILRWRQENGPNYDMQAVLRRFGRPRGERKVRSSV